MGRHTARSAFWLRLCSLCPALPLGRTAQGGHRHPALRELHLGPPREPAALAGEEEEGGGRSGDCKSGDTPSQCSALGGLPSTERSCRWLLCCSPQCRGPGHTEAPLASLGSEWEQQTLRLCRDLKQAVPTLLPAKDSEAAQPLGDKASLCRGSSSRSR